MQVPAMKAAAAATILTVFMGCPPLTPVDQTTTKTGRQLRVLRAGTKRAVTLPA